MQTFETFFNNFILTEGYKEAKTKFNSEPNVNGADVTKYCDLHRKLKELHRLKPEHIYILISFITNYHLLNLNQF